LYCKSYCPLHPDLHKVLFDLIDEVMDAFHADAFHAGMDEVIYIGNKDCRRCHRKDRVQLFADEVKRIHDHVTDRKARMWMWGDRLLDGHTTGIGFWEASYNGTDPAIDRIPKDIVICDWHYDRPEPTAPYFALKGFDVVSCTWKKSDVGLKQLDYIRKMRRDSSYPITVHLLGVVQTVWTQTNIFLSELKHPAVPLNPNHLQIDTGLNKPAATDETEQAAFKKVASEWLKEK
ncbi:MAG: family 20 glycosylhydrolase, partial [Bacteroidota bacterium]|nr:family 20 glycosylhydrolase [Bacteroidota bacterium]